MKSIVVVLAFSLAATSQAAKAGESGDRSVAICRAAAAQSDKAAFRDLSEDQLKEQMCLSSLSVMRSADPMAEMECRLAYKALYKEFSRRHPGKEMVDVYGRC